MPFSMNRAFKKAPRLLARAEGMYYYTARGPQDPRRHLGLWCVNAGHCRKPIVEAVQKAVATLDYAPPFQMGHPAASNSPKSSRRMLPKGMTRMFFTNSGPNRWTRRSSSRSPTTASAAKAIASA
jgi:beta-alanine--pyruvate transaminase